MIAEGNDPLEGAGAGDAASGSAEGVGRSESADAGSDSATSPEKEHVAPAQVSDDSGDAGDASDSAADSLLDEIPLEYTEQGPVEPIELIQEPSDEELEKQWYILKVQVNREDSIRDALMRRVRIAGLERYFGEVIIPTEDVAEFTKTGKRRIVKRKLYPGYIVAHMVINDDTWFLVRETSGIGDFTGSAGKPSPMPQAEIDKILRTVKPDLEGAGQVRTSIPFKQGDRVRVKEGYFQNFEGDVDAIDEAHGRVTVMINIFGRPTPVELEHWQIEAI